MEISVLGLGRMGQAIAGRLLECGHRVTVWNRSPGKAGELVGRGAVEAAGLSEALQVSECSLTMLADDDAVREQALGGDGILEHLPDGACYVDSSTVSPALTTTLAGRFGPDRFAAMPILGAPMLVAAGKATLLPGGAEGTLARLAPLVEALGASAHRYARPALASVAKLTANLLLLNGIVALAESFAVGRAGGLDEAGLRDLLGDSPLVAPGLANRFEGILTGDQEPWWSAPLGAKDARLALRVADEAGVELPLGSATHARLEALASRAREADVAGVGTLYRPGGPPPPGR